MSTRPSGYEDLKELAIRLGENIPDLLALARANDPFFAGSAAQQAKAEWFAGLWTRCGATTGVHLRRLHYWLVSQHGPTMHDGRPYENTEACWGYICDAGKAARYLRLVDPMAFVDRRNPDPHVYIVQPEDTRDPNCDIADTQFQPGLPHIETDPGWALNLRVPDPYITGYGYAPADQPFHIELWVEKSTMDDVLIPVCEDLGLNLVTSLGFQSITGVLSMLQRIGQSGKPARIFYISDYDPAGDGMPVAVARQAEYWHEEYGYENIKLNPLALTREQAARYRLPRIPVKDSDRRKPAWERREGEGATELDALEALYPGTLAQMVREAVQPYRDEGLPSRLYRAELKATSLARTKWSEETHDERVQLSGMQQQAQEIVAKYQGELTRLNDSMQAELEPVRERLEVVWQAVQDKAETFTVDLPERPEPEVDLPDEEEWLLDTDRDYLEQLDIYKAHKNGGSRDE
jgi:hypothetical protein